MTIPEQLTSVFYFEQDFFLQFNQQKRVGMVFTNNV